MAARPSASPSPQARRQAQQLALQAALSAQDSHRVDQLLGQWVHRHGVSSVERLWSELASAEPEGYAWWQGLDRSTVQPEPLQPEPLRQAKPSLRIEPQLPRPARPAPAPSHPALLQLRTWLPDQEERRAA